jgi:hypothetical protein
MVMGYQHMATNIKAFLSSFASTGRVVKGDDIRGFFETLKQNKRQKLE